MAKIDALRRAAEAKAQAIASKFQAATPPGKMTHEEATRKVEEWLEKVATQFMKRRNHTPTLYMNNEAMRVLRLVQRKADSFPRGVNMHPVDNKGLNFTRKLLTDYITDDFLKSHKDPTRTPSSLKLTRDLSPAAKDGAQQLVDVINRAWDHLGPNETLRIVRTWRPEGHKGLMQIRGTAREEHAHGAQYKFKLKPETEEALMNRPSYQEAGDVVIGEMDYPPHKAFGEITAKVLAGRREQLHNLRQVDWLDIAESYRDAIIADAGEDAIDYFTFPSLKPGEGRDVFLARTKGKGQPATTGAQAEGVTGTGRVGPAGGGQLEQGATGGGTGRPPGAGPQAGVSRVPATDVGISRGGGDPYAGGTRVDLTGDKDVTPGGDEWERQLREKTAAADAAWAKERDAWLEEQRAKGRPRPTLIGRGAPVEPGVPPSLEETPPAAPPRMGVIRGGGAAGAAPAAGPQLVTNRPLLPGRGQRPSLVADEDVIVPNLGRRLYRDVDGNTVLDLEGLEGDQQTKALIEELHGLVQEYDKLKISRPPRDKVREAAKSLIGYDPADPLGFNQGEAVLNDQELVAYTNNVLENMRTQFQKRKGHTNTFYANRDANDVLYSLFDTNLDPDDVAAGFAVQPAGREMIMDRMWQRFMKMDGLSPAAKANVEKVMADVAKAWETIGRDKTLSIAMAEKGKAFKGLRKTIREEQGHAAQFDEGLPSQEHIDGITITDEYQQALKGLDPYYLGKSETNQFMEVTAKTLAGDTLSNTPIRARLMLAEMYADALDASRIDTNRYTLVQPGPLKDVFSYGKDAEQVADAIDAQAAAEARAKADATATGPATAGDTATAAPPRGDTGPGRVVAGGDTQLQPGATVSGEGTATGRGPEGGVPQLTPPVVGRERPGGDTGVVSDQLPQGFSFGGGDEGPTSGSLGFLGSQDIGKRAGQLWDLISRPTDENGQPIPRGTAQWSQDQEYNRVMGDAIAERERAEKAGKKSWAETVFNMNALDKFNSDTFSTVAPVKAIQDRISKRTGETPLPGDWVRVALDDGTAGNDKAAMDTKGVVRGLIDKHLGGLSGPDAKAKMDGVGIYTQALQQRQIEVRQRGSNLWNEAVKTDPALKDIEAKAEAGDDIANRRRALEIRIRGIEDYRQALREGEYSAHYTGTPLKKIQERIDQGGKYFQDMAADIQAHYRSMLDESVADGRISREFRDSLVELYPDYVPVTRVFDDLNSNNRFGSTRPMGHLAGQGTVKKLGGPSDLAIENPWQSMVERTYHNRREATRNRVGSEFDRISRTYKGWEEFVRRATPEEIRAGKTADGSKLTEDNSITFLEGGKPVVLVVDPLIANAARNVQPAQVHLLAQIFRGIARTLRFTATGAASPLFQVGNIAMDVGTNVLNTGPGAIFNKNVPSLEVIRDTLPGALGGKDSADLNYLRERGGAMISAEQFRDNPVPQIEWEVARSRTGAGEKARSIAEYAKSHPKVATLQSIAAIEDIASKSELMGRLRVFQTVRDQALASGMSQEQANIAGLDAARNQMANYRQQGGASVVQDVNAVTPYLNAGLRNIASGVEAARNNPGQFALRMGAYVVMPTIMTTIYNLADPEREKAYFNSQGHDKDDNWTMMRPGVTDEDGLQKMSKWPIPGQYSPFVRAFRVAVEQLKRHFPETFDKLAKSMGFAGNEAMGDPAYDTNLLPEDGWEALWDVASKLMPQYAKLYTDIASDTHQFSGKPFVRKDLQAVPKEWQVDKDTSRAITAMARAAGGSPAQWQGRITAAGGQGIPLGLNLMDRAGQAMGLLPPGRPGGIDLSTGFEKRFLAGRGGRTETIDRAMQRRMQDATYGDLMGYLSTTQQELLLQNRVSIAPVTPQEGDTEEIMALRHRIKGIMMSAQLQSVIDHADDFAEESAKDRKVIIQDLIKNAQGWLGGQTTAAGKLDPEQRVGFWQGTLAQVEQAYGR